MEYRISQESLESMVSTLEKENQALRKENSDLKEKLRLDGNCNCAEDWSGAQNGV